MCPSIVIVDCSKQDINKALKEFKRKVIKSGHILELKNKKEYTKPSAAKREQKQKAIRKNKFQTDLVNLKINFNIGKKNKSNDSI